MSVLDARLLVENKKMLATECRRCGKTATDTDRGRPHCEECRGCLDVLEFEIDTPMKPDTYETNEHYGEDLPPRDPE